MLYIVRIGGKDQSCMRLCSPCHECFNCIKKVGIKKIVYVNEHGELQKDKICNMTVSHVSLGNRVLGKTIQID